MTNCHLNRQLHGFYIFMYLCSKYRVTLSSYQKLIVVYVELTGYGTTAGLLLLGECFSDVTGGSIERSAEKIYIYSCFAYNDSVGFCPKH